MENTNVWDHMYQIEKEYLTTDKLRWGQLTICTTAPKNTRRWFMAVSAFHIDHRKKKNCTPLHMDFCSYNYLVYSGSADRFLLRVPLELKRLGTVSATRLWFNMIPFLVCFLSFEKFVKKYNFFYRYVGSGGHVIGCMYMVHIILSWLPVCVCDI